MVALFQRTKKTIEIRNKVKHIRRRQSLKGQKNGHQWPYRSSAMKIHPDSTTTDAELRWPRLLLFQDRRKQIAKTNTSKDRET